MPFLLVTVIIICASSIILSVITRLAIVVQVKEVPSRVRRKDGVTLTVRIKNNFFLPLTPVRVYVKVCEKGIYSPQKKMLIVSLAPFGEVTLNIQNVVSYRGVYLLGLEKVEFFDILKTCKFKIAKMKPWGLVSYPRELTANSVRDDNQDESEVSRTKAHGFNRDAFSHLREYREGESLRLIHWKLSARLPDGELIVKQMESNHDFAALVFCDFTGDIPPAIPLIEGAETDASAVFSAESFMEASDIAIESALAIMRRILLSNNTAIFLWQDARIGGCDIKEVVDLQDCDDLNESLAMLPPVPFDGSFIELFDEFYEDIRLERAIYIITAAITEELVEKLRSTGLIFQRNVIIVAISTRSTENSQKELTEYLTTQTKVTVCRILSDEEDDIKAFNEGVS
jgi:hypothetical protein